MPVPGDHGGVTSTAAAPGARPAPPPEPTPPTTSPRTARPPLLRRREDGELAGVAAGLSAHLGVPVSTVRLVLVVAALSGGAGLVLYGWLWALVPSAAPASGRARSRARRRRDLVLGVLLLVAGAAAAGSQLVGTTALTLLPFVLVGGGALVAYAQLDAVERDRWQQRAGGRAAALRVGAGVVLVAVGGVLVVAQGAAVGTVARTLAATLAVLAGVALVLAPWGLRLWRDLDAERAERAREAERADIAAHLHDSVLQTLTLIQRRSADAGEVARLARAQERDLRGWLYRPASPVPRSLATELAAAAAEVEDEHGVVVDVVTVGDRPGDARTAALVAAVREALVNAARHAGAPASLYVECGPAEVSAFVRDRGVGFDPDAVPPDRLGLRESVCGRVERAGGTAEVVSAPGEGTEVRLRLPVATPSQATPAPAGGAA